MKLDSVFDEHFVKPGANGRTARDHADEELNAMLWEKIAPHVPVTLFGRQRVGLHPLMRMMRYEKQGHLSAHVDGTLEDGTGSSLQGISFLTAFIYLNDDFQGGGTRFFRGYEYCDEQFVYEGAGIIDIAPVAGTLNVFQHDLVHCGLPCSGNRKYGIRAMVVYNLHEGETVDDARLTHVWYPEPAAEIDSSKIDETGQLL